MAYLGVTEQVLAILGREHTLHSCLDLLKALVNDAVGAYVYILTLGGIKRGLIGTNVEANDDRIGCCRKGDVTLGDTACCCVDNANLDFLVGKLEKRCLNRLNRAVNVCLNDDVQILNALGDLCKQIIQVCSCVCLEGVFLCLVAALIRQRSCHSFVLNCLELIACRGNLGKTGDLNGNRGSSCLEGSAQVVGHRTNVTDCRTCNNDVATAERTVLNEDGCNRSAAAVELRLNNDTLCTTVGICLELLNIGYEQYALQEIVNTLSCQSRYGNADGISAPLLGNKTVLCQLLLDLIGISGGLIHLIDSNNNVDLRCFCVVDRLNGLGHNAVVCCYDKDCDIGCHCTACTHCGKRCVTGGIEEGDVTASRLHTVSTDVLGNTACLACGDVGVTDSIENRGLTVVNVTHNTNNGGALLELLVGVNCVIKQTLLNADNYLGGSFNAELICYECGSIKVDDLVDGCHHAHEHQLFNNLACCYVELGCELTDYDLRGELNRGGLVINRLLNGRCRALTSLILFVVLVALTECVLTAPLRVVLLFELLVAACKVLVAIGYKVIQTLVIFGKVNGRGVRIDYTGTLARSVRVDVCGCAAYDGLRFEGILGCALNEIALIAVKSTASAIVVLVEAAAVFLLTEVIAALRRTTAKALGALCTTKGRCHLCCALRCCRTCRSCGRLLLYVNTGGTVLLRTEGVAGVGLTCRGTCCGCGILCGSCGSSGRLGRRLFLFLFFCLLLCYVLRTNSGSFFLCLGGLCSLGFGSGLFLFGRLFSLFCLLRLLRLLFCRGLFNLFGRLFSLFHLFSLFDFGGNIGYPIQITADVGDLICLCQGLKQNIKFQRFERLLGSLCLNSVLSKQLYKVLALHSQVFCKLGDLKLLIDSRSHISS